MTGLPNQDADLIVHSINPLNAEPPLDRLRSRFLTEAGDFYVRSHGAIPELDPDIHQVAFTGLLQQPLQLTLADMKGRFASRTVTAVLQCAGNRRADFQAVEPTSGDPWAPGAIGNAEWTGVALADVLRAAETLDGADLHVAFRAADIAAIEGEEDAPFGVSIPLDKAMSGDVLLAWAMNGEPLTRRHGAPLRVVVPGYAGVRSAKWVAEVMVQDKPSDAYHQAQDYLLFPSDMRKDTQDCARGTPINDMPLNAAICEPAAGAALAAGETLVRGYAIATDGAISRVDLSVDGGHTWRQATLDDNGGQRWAWTFWHAHIRLPVGEHEIVVRAWDSAGRTQPARPSEGWNFKGYLCTAWHRVRVTAA